MISGSTRAPADWKVPMRSVPASPAAQRLQVGLRGLEPRDDRVRVAEEQLAGLGQRDGPWAAGALDELLADDSLERRDLLADRGLGVPEPLGGPPEGALAAIACSAAKCRSSTPSQLSGSIMNTEYYHDLC